MACADRYEGETSGKTRLMEVESAEAERQRTMEEEEEKVNDGMCRQTGR
eukprot:CAMPEP_0184352564 /NCGR_PEP_ID=MMETSP1089-20130417/67376_1 /TAXON_ID=38269 ORGANISM="Gloeochaete wittrockiana, Strain SAG46.84" /NCGR_SAMPLE_ID=MMETSP1089 /ASSEMBLY_ACC=CAM_ASM_000445 /LENGTH=48 /DNA_ID= /DNA_START= /DNA_END= /DNA_ORIENTATION=